MKKTFLGSKLINKKEIRNYDFVYLGVPYEKGCAGRKGTASAPDSIREKSFQYYWPEWNGFYDPELDKTVLVGVKIGDIGNSSTSFGKIVKDVFDLKKVPIIVGGDHSISFEIINNINQEVQVIQLDAHSDYQRQEETDSSPSGMVMRRIKSIKNVSKIIQIGMRGYLNSKSGFRDSKKDGNSIITWTKYKEEGCKSFFKEIRKNLPTYLTIDSDFLDPTICPGTTVPEPNGALYSDIQEILKKICQNTKLIGFDIVEYNPLFDQNQTSSLYLTKIILDLISYIFEIKNANK